MHTQPAVRISLAQQRGGCCARGLLSVLTWLVSPIVLGCLVVLLVFWLIVVQGQRLRFKREKSKLRVEFDSYRREMQVKVRCPRACILRWCTPMAVSTYAGPELALCIGASPVRRVNQTVPSVTMPALP